jgi:hypothetical protein
MAINKTDCSCGEQHEFEKDIIKKMDWGSAPDFIECSECPICSPDLLDKPEDHEDEAYKEEVDIEELEKALEDDQLGNIEEIDEDFEEEEY